MPTQKTTNKKATRGAKGGLQAIRTNRNKATAKKRWQRKCQRLAKTLIARTHSRRTRWVDNSPNKDAVEAWLKTDAGADYTRLRAHELVHKIQTHTPTVENINL